MAQDGTVMSLETEDRGFAISKEVAEKDGEHVQLDLEITSSYDVESIVTVAESVPPGTAHSQIGFLPNHEPQEWDLSEDGTLLLTARLVPEGTRQIIYGLREIEPAEADPLGNEPRVAEIGGPAAEVAPEAEPAPADEGTDAADDGADAEPPEPTAVDASGASAAETDGGAGATEEATADDASVATPLDDETAEQVAAAIEPHLDVGRDTDPVTETKLSQLQEDVADMRAYLPAFEDFLGETGRADDILTELDSIQVRLDDLEDGTDEDVEAAIADVESTVDEVQDTVGEVQETVDAVQERFDDVEAELAELGETVSGLEQWRQGVAEASKVDGE